MIQINYDMKMPDNCWDCPLVDEEFNCCHGHNQYIAWELDKYNKGGKPDWCPLVEVRYESKRNN